MRTIPRKPKTGLELIDRIVSLGQLFGVAVAERDENMAGILLEEITINVHEVQSQGVISPRDSFAQQAYLMHVHNIEAMKLHGQVPPNWGALAAREQVIAGFVNELYKRAISFGPLDSPQRSPLI